MGRAASSADEGHLNLGGCIATDSGAKLGIPVIPRSPEGGDHLIEGFVIGIARPHRTEQIMALAGKKTCEQSPVR
jgi:hypothetical protein